MTSGGFLIYPSLRLFFRTALDDALETLPLTIITTVVILLALRFFKRIPESLFGLLTGLVVNELFIRSPHVVGTLPFRFPKPVLELMPFPEIGAFLMPAFTICLIGSLSALLSAEVTDEMLRVRHDSNRELISQGLGNLVSSLIGGLPVSGAVARSGVNVHSGGRTRLSSILHSVFLLLMVLVFYPVVKRIPLASLAVVLMIASVRTVAWKSLKLIPHARWSYGVIMTVTTVLTVVKDLVIAVVVGVVLTGIVVLVELAFSPRGKEVRPLRSKAGIFSLPPELQVIAFQGPLFFVGVEKLRQHIREVAKNSVFVLDFAGVTMLDETGALALQDLVQRLRRERKSVYLGGLQRGPMRMLLRTGVVASLGRLRLCKHLATAVRRAAKELSQEGRGSDLSPVVLKPVDRREGELFDFYVCEEDA